MGLTLPLVELPCLHNTQHPPALPSHQLALSHAFAGYVGRPDLTEEKFVPNPFLADVLPFLPPRMHAHYRLVYRTGDLVAWRKDSSGKYQVRGRLGGHDVEARA